MKWDCLDSLPRVRNIIVHVRGSMADVVLCFALLSSHFQVKPTHSLHTTTDKLSRHAYTLPCPVRGGSYDAVDTIDVQAPCWVATRQCGGYILPLKTWKHGLSGHRLRWSTTTVQGGPPKRTAIPKRASAEVVKTVTNYSSRTTRRRTLTRSKNRATA